jgi:hypothetical protein
MVKKNRPLPAFERETRYPACAREFVVSNTTLHPNAETEKPTPICSCGEITARPRRVNTERLVVKKKIRGRRS